MSLLIYGANGLPINADANGGGLSALIDQQGFPLARNNAASLPAVHAGVMMAGQNDNTSRVLRLDRFGSIRTGFDNLLFHDDVEGTTLNTQLWTQSLTTFTMAQVATTGINFNSGNGVASGSASILTSQKWFSKTQLGPLRFRNRMRVIPQTNAIAECGFGNPVGVTAQIPTGAFWRYTSAGSVVPVIAYNGSDVVTGSSIAGSLNAANYYTWGIIVDDDSVLFTCQDVSTGQIISEQTLQIPITQPRMFSTTHISSFTRLYTSGITASAAYIYLADAIVVGLDLMTNKPWSHQLASSSVGGIEFNPTTFAQNTNYANSAAPASATLSNTAAGYTTLGGQYQFVPLAGAETDYALFGFQVPSPYSMYVTGIHIGCFNMGAAVATTPSLMQWGVSCNAPAVTLASNTTRRTIGTSCLPIGSPIGYAAADLDINFDGPLKTDAGRFFHIIVKLPVGTVTASQIIRGCIDVRGYIE